MWIDVVATCQKLGIILEKKVLQKVKLSKSVNRKKCDRKFILFNAKNQKDLGNF